jgi:hypothetical protein
VTPSPALPQKVKGDLRGCAVRTAQGVGAGAWRSLLGLQDDPFPGPSPKGEG